MPEITQPTISSAWFEAVKLASKSQGKQVQNLVVNVTGFDSSADQSDTDIRSALDQSLASAGKFSVATVANTIFPMSLTHPGQTRDQLYERYLKLWPRISRCAQNRRGTYFQRLISYPNASGPRFNQLEFVIEAYKGGTKRRSALQCGILNPPTDLNATPYQGFPCMQQLSFHPEGKGGLQIAALYPMQYLWARAYGNYLGLINLGQFAAKGMGLKLTRMTCIALVAKFEEPSVLGHLGVQ